MSARNPLGLRVGATVSLLVGLLAALSWLWTPWPLQDVDMDARLLPISSAHWLGTDALGRDVLSLLMAGSRNALLVGVVAVGIGLSGGTLLGLWAAARRGWVEQLILRAADIGFAFPALISALIFTAVWGPGIGNAIAAIGLHAVPTFARVARGAALAVWSRDYVLAARACGKGRWRITWDHVLPNIAAPLIVQATIQFALAVLAEAALSYLGLGTQPPEPSWGRMLAEAQSWMFQAPQLALWPGLAIVITVLGLNLLGDGLRDRLDPRLERGR
ncbi:ABC transporter permease [Pelomonas sp. SE-A7]|uniref:ABC transporter permease n=1 Tax=Pelomonas sp. SE-A7 TaxID=3054953 RepID=UPI00259CF574|nr:ABC transporter permease [Pelomonas sp. SE-A7]MDM4768181.1 ABC transporter permease [Pelomonas sp. SE-A7]